MTAETIRVTPDWLRLREPADAAARSTELVAMLHAHLPAEGAIGIHDLGCGTGSMMRWLAPLLTGPQDWVLYERDEDLLAVAASTATPATLDGRSVTVQTRVRDITRLPDGDLDGATLIVASALLDMLTRTELTRLVDSCTRAQCPVLITLTVVGRVELVPAEQADADIAAAFNDHQRRTAQGRLLLGPDAVECAADLFAERGYDVHVQSSIWMLAEPDAALTVEWLQGWVDAAFEQCPDLRETAIDYSERRLGAAAAGRLGVTLHHRDLLALPR